MSEQKLISMTADYHCPWCDHKEKATYKIDDPPKGTEMVQCEGCLKPYVVTRQPILKVGVHRIEDLEQLII